MPCTSFALLHHALGSFSRQSVLQLASSEVKCAHAAGAKTTPSSSPSSVPVLINCTVLHATFMLSIPPSIDSVLIYPVSGQQLCMHMFLNTSSIGGQLAAGIVLLSNL